MPSLKMFRSLPNPFKPPFPGLMAILLAYFVLCFFIDPTSSVRQGVLTDPDANMYLTETLNLLDGQSWFDRVEHRLNPPEGVTIHFSRIAELPYALIIAPLRPFIGRVRAAFLAAVVWPPIFLLGFMLVMRWEASYVMPRAWAGLAALVTLFTQAVTFEFIPGRAGHRGLVPLLVALVIAFLSHFLFNPKAWRWPAAAGAALALALSFSMEAMPWIAVLAGAFGFWATAQGGEDATKGGLAFGFGLAAAGMIFLMLHQPPAQWFVSDPIYFSWIFVALFFEIAGCFAVVWMVRDWPLGWRLSITAGMAVLLGGGFVVAHPHLLAGPYGQVDSELANLMLLNIQEAVPLYVSLKLGPLLLVTVPWPLLSLTVCLWHIRHRQGPERWLWSAFALLQITGFAMAVFYEARCVDYMQMFGIVPLTTLLYHGLCGREHSRGLGVAARRLLVLVALPLIALGPDAMIGSTTPAGLAFFPMQVPMEPCRDVRAAADTLNRPPPFGDKSKPRLIINTLDEGPALLLMTRDSVLAGPYPEDVTGNTDALGFFRATDSDLARRIAYGRRADFVLACRYAETSYLVPAGKETDFYKTGYIDVPNPVPMAYRFMRGVWPNWLIAIDPGELGDSMLFQLEPRSGFHMPGAK